MASFAWLDSKTFHPSIKTRKNEFLLILFSHIANLIPITIAVIKDVPDWFLAVLILQLIFSILYHLFFTKGLLRIIDWAFANLLIASNVYLYLHIHELLIAKSIILFLLILAGARHFMSFKKYGYHHSVWHIYASLITSVILF